MERTSAARLILSGDSVQTSGERARAGAKAAISFVSQVGVDGWRFIKPNGPVPQKH